jgi:hypoxanthine-DNA glycosylase
MTSATQLIGFPPITDHHTKLLILGSFPGVASLQVAQYYAHPRNQFWRLIGDLIQCDLVHQAYEDRLVILRAHRIGLWDVIASAQRQGSLDANIRNAVDNPLITLLATLPQLQAIGFNGGTASRLGLKILGDLASRYQLLSLPSSSPAHTMPYSNKLCTWRALSDYLA